jgi:cell division protein YceG involved in septum cleavage
VRVTLDIAFLIVVVVVMLGLVKQLYQFGHDVFAEEPGTGVEVTIDFTVAEGESARTTAKRLKSKNLISSEWVFLTQRILYEKEIVAGTHELHSNMTTLEILSELSMPTENP